MKINLPKQFVPLVMVAAFWLLVAIAHALHRNAAPGLIPLPSCHRVVMLIVPGLRAGDWDDETNAPDFAKLTRYCPTALFPIPAPLRNAQASALSPDDRLRLACARLLGATETAAIFAKKSTVRLTVLDSGDAVRSALPAASESIVFVPPSWSVAAPNVAGGQATDPARFAQFTRTVWLKRADRSSAENNAPDLVVAVLDDVYRADGYAPLCLPSAAQKARQSALRRVSETIAALTTRGSYGELYPDAVLVAAPLPSALDTGGAEEAKRMGFLLLWNLRDEKGSHLLLTSPSTRHTLGVVAFGDLAPTLWQMLGVTDAKNAGGRPIETVVVRNGGRAFAAQTAQWAAQWRELRFIVVLPWILAGLLIAAVYFSTRQKPRLSTACALFACALPAALWAAASVPLLIAWGASLVRSSPVGELGGGGWVLYGLAFLLAVVTAAVPLARITSFTKLLLVVAGATVGLVALDLALGGPLLGRSPFSYSVLEGARFYGIGNEASGVFLGASLVWAALLPASRANFVTRLLTGLGVVCVLGLPTLGADAGGAAASLVGWGTLIALLVSKPRRKIAFACAALCALFLLAGLAVWESKRPASEQTHLGQVVSQTRAGNKSDGAVAIARRKIAVNARLSVTSPWAVLLATEIGLCVYLWRAAKKRGGFSEATRSGAIALFVGAFVSFAVNDSGVVMAATVLLFGPPFLLAESSVN